MRIDEEGVFSSYLIEPQTVLAFDDTRINPSSKSSVNIQEVLIYKRVAVFVYVHHNRECNSSMALRLLQRTKIPYHGLLWRSAVDESDPTEDAENHSSSLHQAETRRNCLSSMPFCSYTPLLFLRSISWTTRTSVSTPTVPQGYSQQNAQIATSKRAFCRCNH